LLVAAVAERDLSTTAVSAGVGAGAGLGGTAVVTLMGVPYPVMCLAN